MPFESRFRPLTPNDAIDLSHYQDALDFVFSSNEIRNIALTGSYGSGKSSVIRSYENIHKDNLAFIHISLARFEEQGQTIGNPTEQTKTVNILEGKIINQLLHQIREKDIPRAYIQLQDKTSWIQHLFVVFATLALGVLGIYVFQFQKWSSTVAGLDKSLIKPLLLATTNPYGRLIGIGLLLILLGGGAFYILRTYPFRVLFKKLDLKGLVGIELFSAEEDTYFDKYLHNVLYLFDKANADAIVFEDLDRYDVTLIFEKLREINDLAYCREKQGLRQGKKPLRFFYLIRDDIFTASDRSKFFDFIIPVVPYVDASNSCDQLLQRFKEAGLDGIFTKRFLQDVSLYLSDMRLLTNIVNEYIVYRGRLSNSGLATKPDRQLAMVIYKNLYPGDFDLLQKGRGYVFTLFQSKKDWIQKHSLRLTEEIDMIRQRIELSQQEHLKSLDELNALFFPLLEGDIIINGTSVGGNLSRIELVRQILENPNVVSYIGNSGYGRAVRINVKEKQTEMESNPDYVRRKTQLAHRNMKRQKEIISEIQTLENEKARLSLLNLRELIHSMKTDEEDAFWSPALPTYEPVSYVEEKIQNTKNFRLLQYLIRNGYIDENYAAYVSYFYPNSLSAQDRNFLLSIADRAPLEYDYLLNRPDAVLERLGRKDFARREIRNFDLMAYLLKTKNPNLRILLQSGREDNSAYLFFAEFWRKGRISTRAFRFIRALHREQPEWFRLWCEAEGILLEGEWRSFILDALYFLPSNCLERINKENWLTQKISSDPEFLMLNHPSIRRLIPALKTLSIQFSRVDYREEDIPLVQEICRENLYVLNLSMLKTSMAVFWSVLPDEVEKRSYSYILRHPEEPLTLRVLDNMDTYADVILHESDTRFSDSKEAAISFLNCDSLSEPYKTEYIQRMDTVLENIDAVISRTLWSALLENQCVAYTWQNIADYFAEFSKDADCLPPELTAFLNSSNGPLGWSYSQLNQRIGNQSGKLCRAVLVNQELSLERYRAALAGMTFSYSYNPFPFTDIPKEQMKIILELGIAPVTANNVAVIRENYPELWNDFILPNGTKKLIELMDTSAIQLTEPELASLLMDSRMSDKTAEEMLFIFSDTVSLKDRTFSNTVRARIVEAHLNPKEIPLLLKSFTQESPRVRSAFLGYAKEHSDSVADAVDYIHLIPTEVYAACLKTLTENQLLALRPYLTDSNFEIVCTENKKPKFPNSPEVQAILNSFKAYHWISSWKVKGEKIIAYPTRK